MSPQASREASPARAPAAVPETMRALVMDRVGFEHLKVQRVKTPRPGPRQMLARVDAAGVCTSLIKLVEQGPEHKFLYGWDITRHPVILGDEGSVTLVEVGEELRARYRVGERYIIQPAVDHAPINHRERYRNGAEGIHKVAVGYTLGGQLAEYVLISEEILAAGCLIPLPDPSLAHAHAAMSEPLSCVISAQDHHLHLGQPSPGAPRSVAKGLRPGGVTVVVGAGAMGRMHVDLALSYRPRAIVVSDFIDARLERVTALFLARAKERGVALHAVNGGKTDVAKLVDELTERHGADDVIVAVGSPKAVQAAQPLAGRGAVLNLFGGLKKGEDVVGFDTSTIHYKEINITGSSGGSPWDIARTLELMAAGDLDAGAHITKIGDLDHAVEFLRMVMKQEIDGKAVCYPHRPAREITSIGAWSAEDERQYLQG